MNNNSINIQSVPPGTHAGYDKFAAEVDALSYAIAEAVSIEVSAQYNALTKGEDVEVPASHNNNTVHLKEHSNHWFSNHVGFGIGSELLLINVKVSLVADYSSELKYTAVANIDVCYGDIKLFTIDGRHISVVESDGSVNEIPKVDIGTFFSTWNTSVMLYDHLSTKILTLAAGKALLSLINLSLSERTSKDGHVVGDAVAVTFKPLSHPVSKPLSLDAPFTGGFSMSLYTYRLGMLHASRKASFDLTNAVEVRGDTVTFNGIKHGSSSSRKSAKTPNVTRKFSCRISNPVTNVVSHNLSIWGH